MLKKLNSNYQNGSLTLSNRIVMAPMTRRRADIQTGSPLEISALYYQQRSSAGLIITEGTRISPVSMSSLRSPGIYTIEQIEGWKQVADAVHSQNGNIFVQLLHSGRISHTSIQPNGLQPLGPSDIRAEVNCFGYDENGNPSSVPCSSPRAMTTDEIRSTIDDYSRAALNARKAGIDGIELHAANGYLFEQFLSPHLNNRTDDYGGSMENRARLIIESAKACADSIGPDRVSVRFSPDGRQNGIPENKDYKAVYIYLAKELQKLNIGFLHISDQKSAGSINIFDDLIKSIRELYKGAIILCGGFNVESAEAALETGLIDLVAFGKPFIANPDFVSRVNHGYPLATPNRATYEDFDGRGYSDYPAYENQAVNV